MPSPPRTQVEFEYSLHRQELCASAHGVGERARLACAATNASNGANNDTRARCSGFARLSHVLQASHADSAGTVCCNTLGRRPADLAPILSCTYGPTATVSLLLTLTAVSLVPLGGVLLATALRRCKRARARREAARAKAAATEGASEGLAAGLTAAPMDDADATERAALKGAHDERPTANYSRLGEALLQHLTPTARDARRRLLRWLAEQIGGQRANADNQAEHLESLLFSHLGRCHGVMSDAVDAMHQELLGSFYRWRLHTSMGGRPPPRPPTTHH